MGALLEQMRLEWRIQRRRPFVWFCFLGYFLLAFGDTVRSGWSATGNFWINGGSMITIRAIIYSVLGVVAVAGLIAEPMARDRAQRTQGLVLSTGAGRITLGLGRFLVAFMLVILSAAMFVPGTVLGSWMPGIPTESVGPTALHLYVEAMLYFIVPNFLIASAVVFVVGSRFQSQAMAYAAAVGGVALWVTTRMMLGRDVLRHDVFTTYALLDPYGSIAQLEFSIGWSVAQLNERFPPLQSLFLYNRLIWGSVGVLLVILGVWLLPMRETLARAGGMRRRRLPLGAKLSRLAPSLPGELGRMTAWELRFLWRHPGSKICLVFVAFSLWWSAASVVTQLFSLPTTDLLVHNTGYYFDKVLVLVIVWVAGDLLWRERSLEISEVIDAQPTRDATRFLAKTLALIGIVAMFWILSIVVNITYQATHHYYNFELWLYWVDSFVFKAPYYLWLAVLAVAVQAIVRQRYVAMGVVFLVYLSSAVFDAMHWYHPLFRYGEVSFFFYSLMDGYGHFWRAHLWFLLYWSLGAAAIWMIGYGCYGRGVNPEPRRWLWRQRLARGGGAAALTTFVVLFLLVGAYIHVQSTVRATWPPIDEDRGKAAIEMQYGDAWRGKPQPRVVAMEGVLDMYPGERRFVLDGEFALENQSDEAIEDVLILAEPWLKIDAIDLGNGARCVSANEKLNVQQWRLPAPLEPGQRMTMKFTTSSEPPAGFAVHAKNDDIAEVSPVEVLGNGTSLLNLKLMPVVGYTDRVEHKPAWKRRRLGLPEQWNAPSGPQAERTAHATLHTGWVEHVDMTIKTAGDQIALHGGKLVDSWREPDGRMAYHYRIDHPNRGWSEILSARYVESRYSRDGQPDVVLYHDPNHTYTIDAMAQAYQDAMAHFIDRYGPPPFETFRMAEQSLHFDEMGSRSGMGFSTEILGWKTDLSASDGEDLNDMAAKMMGMCWFGDQLIPANVAGAKIIHSGLPYWTAALYLHQHREPNMDRNLRLQSALEMFRNRGEMTDQEMPFDQEFKDSGMIRKKGSVEVLYLAHLVGVEKLEAIIAEFLDQYRYQGPPYPTAEDFLDHLRARIDEQYHPQIADLFERITTWRLKVQSATVEPTADGKWKLTATVEVKKLYTSGWGEEVEAESNTPVQIVAFKGRGFGPEDVIASRDERLPSGVSEVEMLLDEKPTRFGVDPYLFLPDPNVYDNVRGVSAGQ